LGRTNGDPPYRKNLAGVISVTLGEHNYLRPIRQYLPQHAVQYDAIVRGVIKADIPEICNMHSFGIFCVHAEYKLTRPFDDKLTA
jgi:hypothetical protein